MKKLTNKLNLPSPLFKAIANDSYDKGESDYTATSLIEPARIGALKKQHEDEIVEDASDLIYSLQGQSVHTILERAAKDLKSEGYIAEERFYSDIDGKKVGAQVDVFHPPTGLLQDYKVTSVYSVKDGIKEEYAQQMNIQAELLRRNGHDVKKMEIVAILRDWSKGEYERAVKEFGQKAKYPATQVAVLEVPLIPSDEVVGFIRDRIKAHEDARSGSLPLCSSQERWATPPKWAVKQKGQKRAMRLFDNKEEAMLFSSENKGTSIEFRPEVSRRCEAYCPVAKWCKQYQDSKKETK